MPKLTFTQWISVFFTISIFIACNSTKKIKTGDDAFNAGQYWRAIGLYTEELEKTSKKNQQHYIAFQIASAYEKMNEPISASEWYKHALSYDESDILTQLRYAYSLKNTANYKEAIATFNQISQELNDPGRFQNELVSIKNAIDWIDNIRDNPYLVSICNFNTPESDYGSGIDSSGYLYITQDNANTDENTYLWTGRSYSRINKVDSNQFISASIHSFLNEKDVNTGLLQFNSRNDALAFCKCVGSADKDKTCKIYYSRKVENNWQEPFPVEFTVDSLNYLSPSFSKDGNTLYFSCEDPKLKTGFDIYSSRLVDNEWTSPVRLPDFINSSYNEKYVTSNNDTLYISSDNTVGMGGLDIFKTYQINSRWTPLQNLKAPINSAYDDFYLTVINNNLGNDSILQRGYFTSNRPGGKGNDDIYKFIKRQLVRPSKVDTPVIVDKFYYFKLKIYVKGYKIVDGYESQDQEDMILLDSAQVSIKIDTQFDKTLFTNSLGIASTNLEITGNIKIIASHTGYLKTPIDVLKDNLRIDSSKTLQELTLVVKMHPLIFDQELVIPDIFYDYDRSNIRSDATPSMQRLADLLLLNNEYNILIGSHTDCRGSDVYNKRLSEDRAKSVVEWLVKKGITPNRLRYIGYGKSDPAVKCPCNTCSESDHQLNRRTTFKLIR